MDAAYNKVNGNRLWKLINERANSLGAVIYSPGLDAKGLARPSTLRKMLADAKMPDTQINAVCDAYDALCDALADLELDMMLPFETDYQVHSEV